MFGCAVRLERRGFGFRVGFGGPGPSVEFILRRAVGLGC